MKIIIANWKLNSNKIKIKNYFKIWKKHNINNKLKIIIAPPIIYIPYIQKILKKYNIYNIKLCAQNIDFHTKGPYTGEISAKMLKDNNIKYVILGHSERKKWHYETNYNILKKIILSKKYNIKPIICIGENINEYINKKSLEICIQQLNYLVKKSNLNIFINTIIAYEPIWAIGTGQSANILHIKNIHKYIKKYLNNINPNNNTNTKVIYGGSINQYNIASIINNKYINGALIGKTSLDIQIFMQSIQKLN